jgi:hypothetical protein
MHDEKWHDLGADQISHDNARARSTERRDRRNAGKGCRADMTTRERAQRNAEIVETRVRGAEWSEVASRHGVSERQAKRVLADYRASRPGLHERDPIEVVEQALDEYDEVIAELRLLGRTTRHDGTKVGALKARLQATDSRLALLQAVGVLPANLGHLRVEHDVRFVANAIPAVAQ